MLVGLIVGVVVEVYARINDPENTEGQYGIGIPTGLLWPLFGGVWLGIRAVNFADESCNKIADKVRKIQSVMQSKEKGK